jgi:lambda family phage portal protein
MKVFDTIARIPVAIRQMGADFGAVMKGLPGNQYELGRFNQLYGHISDHVRSMFGHHSGGEQTRLQGDWSTTYDTPYRNFAADRERIIARSIRAVDNDMYASGIMESIVADVVGMGIKPQPRVVDSSGKPATAINKQLADEWKRVNDEIDATGHCTYYDLQAVILREIITCGAVLTNKVALPGSRLGYGLQLTNVLRLDPSADINAPSYGEDPRRKQTVFGIDLDAVGRPLAYHIKGIDKPISAGSMRQAYRQQRAEQYTGMPWFYVALRYLWANESLLEDKLVASRIQSMIGLFIPDSMYNLIASKQTNTDKQMTMERGRIYRGKANEEPKVIQPGDSIQTLLVPLTKLLMHGISMTLGYSYQTVTRDVTEINMAAGKINTSKDHQAARNIQRWFVKDSCQRDWNDFVRYAVLNGRISGINPAAYLADPWIYNECQWRAPGWDYIDPYREAQADVLLLNNNMMTLETHYSERGGVDWRDALTQIAAEKEFAKELGLTPAAPVAAAAPAGKAIPAGQGEPADEGQADAQANGEPNADSSAWN